MWCYRGITKVWFTKITFWCNPKILCLYQLQELIFFKKLTFPVTASFLNPSSLSIFISQYILEICQSVFKIFVCSDTFLSKSVQVNCSMENPVNTQSKRSVREMCCLYFLFAWKRICVPLQIPKWQCFCIKLYPSSKILTKLKLLSASTLELISLFFLCADVF